MKEPIYLYCDGGCRGNQSKENIGGYGVLLKYKDSEAEYYGAERNTTNNKQELTSLIVGLSKIKHKDKPVVVTMDSQYVIEGINTWSKNWKENGFKKSNGEEILNKMYWVWLLDNVVKFDDITFKLCKGHSDNDGNNRADFLANYAMDEMIKGEKSD